MVPVAKNALQMRGEVVHCHSAAAAFFSKACTHFSQVSVGPGGGCVMKKESMTVFFVLWFYVSLARQHIRSSEQQ